jgi:hypothetical protein
MLNILLLHHSRCHQSLQNTVVEYKYYMYGCWPTSVRTRNRVHFQSVVRCQLALLRTSTTLEGLCLPRCGSIAELALRVMSGNTHGSCRWTSCQIWVFQRMPRFCERCTRARGGNGQYAWRWIWLIFLRGHFCSNSSGKGKEGIGKRTSHSAPCYHIVLTILNNWAMYTVQKVRPLDGSGPCKVSG